MRQDDTAGTTSVQRETRQRQDDATADLSALCRPETASHTTRLLDRVSMFTDSIVVGDVNIPLDRSQFQTVHRHTGLKPGTVVALDTVLIWGSKGRGSLTNFLILENKKLS